MKIIVSAVGNTKESKLDRRFGRCEYFSIYDTEIDTYRFVENKGALASGGAGIKAASQVIDENSSVIITGNLGPNAFELLEKTEIKVYTCDEVSVFEAIELYKSGDLDEIKSAGQSHRGMI